VRRRRWAQGAEDEEDEAGEDESRAAASPSASDAAEEPATGAGRGTAGDVPEAGAATDSVLLNGSSTRGGDDTGTTGRDDPEKLAVEVPRAAMRPVLCIGGDGGPACFPAVKRSSRPK